MTHNTEQFDYNRITTTTETLSNAMEKRHWHNKTKSAVKEFFKLANSNALKNKCFIKHMEEILNIINSNIDINIVEKKLYSNFHILLELLLFHVELPLHIEFLILIAIGIVPIMLSVYFSTPGTSAFVGLVCYGFIFLLMCCLDEYNKSALELRSVIKNTIAEISNELELEKILSKLPDEDFKKSIYDAESLSAKECYYYATMAHPNKTPITFFPNKWSLQSEEKQKQRARIQKELDKVLHPSPSAPEHLGGASPAIVIGRYTLI